MGKRVLTVKAKKNERIIDVLTRVVFKDKRGKIYIKTDQGFI